MRKSLFVMLTIIALLGAGLVTFTANAQSGDTATPPATQAAPGGGRGGRGGGNPAGMMANAGAFMAVQACSATNYDDVVAKALGISAADLRVGLVGGKSLQDLATAKSVSLDTIRTAIMDAEKADVAQAVKDGVITQAQADFITGLMDRIPTASSSQATPAATPPANGGNGNRPRPNALGARVGLAFIGITPNVTVKNYVVAAQAINISCAQLITAMQQGRQSIAQVAQGKNVTAQTVIDALVKAHTDALDQEVKEGLITSAQKDGQASRLTAQLTAFVNGRQGAGGFGVQPGAFGGQPGNPAQRGQNGPASGNRGRLGGLACRLFGFCGGQGAKATPMPTQAS